MNLLAMLLVSAGASAPTSALDFATEIHPGNGSIPSRHSISFNREQVSLGLSDAIALGLRDNRAIRSAFLQRVAQKFDLRVAEDKFTNKLMLQASAIAGRNQDESYRRDTIAPTTTLSSRFGTQLSFSWENSLSQGETTGPIRNNGLSFSVIQPLLRDGGFEAATASVRFARLTEKLNQLTLKLTVSQTIGKIASAYRELLRAQDQLRIASEALERANQLIEINRALIDAGRMAAFEIVQAEADAATQELSVEETANTLDANRRELLHLLALDLNTPIRADDALDAKWVEINTAKALELASERQPAYLLQLISAEQALITLQVAKNQRLWNVSLVAGRSLSRDTLPLETRMNPAPRDHYAGIRVDIPLGQLAAQQAEIQARVNVQDQAIRNTEAKQLLDREVGDAVRNLKTRWKQYEIAQRAMALTSKKMEIEQEKLTVGRSSNFQVLSFEADLRNAENSKLNALIGYLNAQTTLAEKLGMTLESWDITLDD